MRIIAGKYGGRRITPPYLSPTRPTTDYAREGLFNILESRFDLCSISFLDLFGGTGCISYEMASRGCTDIVTVEKHPQCIAFIKKTIVLLNTDAIKPIRADVFTYLEHCERQFNLIFAGPPYTLKNLSILPDLIFSKNILTPTGWFILEHNPAHDFQKHPCFIEQRKYGTTIFAFFKSKFTQPDNKTRSTNPSGN